MARFQPSHLSVSNPGAPTHQLARRNGDAYQDVVTSQVHDSSDMVDFIGKVKTAIALEARGKTQPVLTNIEARAKEANNSVKLIAPLFKDLRAQAQSVGATTTDDAILVAAAWYYNNVEKPALGQSTSSGYKAAVSGTGVSGAGASGTPFYTATWFKVAAPLTAALLLGGLIIFWPQGDEKPKASKPKRKLVMKEAKGKRVERKPTEIERQRRAEAEEFLGRSEGLEEEDPYADDDNPFGDDEE